MPASTSDTTRPADTARADDGIRRVLDERDAAVRALQDAVRDTTRLTRLFTILNEPAPIADTLDRALATLSELFAADIVALLRPDDDDGTRVKVRGGIGWPLREMHHRLAVAPGGPIDTAMSRQAPVVEERLTDETEVSAYLNGLGAASAAWLPVRGDEQSHGVLLMARCRPAPFSRADADLLAAMAYRIGLALDREWRDEQRALLQARLSRAEKAESLARMAGAVAHHFNNMLGVIAGSIELVLDDLPGTHASRLDLRRALQACGRAADMSGLMLTYLGQNPPVRTPTDLVATVDAWLRDRRVAEVPAVRVMGDVPARRLTVGVGQARIDEVLHHLVSNAVEALGDAGGDVRVRVRRVEARDLPAGCQPDMSAKPRAAVYAMLEVADSGAGMDRETLESVFDPFFTTKSVGRGLGLAVVFGIVRGHDGLVMAESAPGRGATFRVYWPLLGESAWSDEPLDDGARGADACECPLILVVDDEEMVRVMAARLLEHLGYQVVCAADGEDGLARFRERAHDWCAAVIDVVMPGRDGWSLLSEMRSTHPDLPVVMASGYNEASLPGAVHAHHAHVFLHKPFGIPGLQTALERAIAEQRGPRGAG